jgi:hypothetical protein
MVLVVQSRKEILPNFKAGKRPGHEHQYRECFKLASIRLFNPYQYLNRRYTTVGDIDIVPFHTYHHPNHELQPALQTFYPS